jgi:hypothetical protein
VSSRFWLTCCDSSQRLQGVVIVDSEHLMEAHMLAGLSGAHQGAEFCEGHELDPQSAGLIPPAAVGRMLAYGRQVDPADRAPDSEAACRSLGAANARAEAGLAKSC